MRIQTYLPEAVKNSIRRHVRKAVTNALEAHSSAQEDEDTITGQLGALLRTTRPKQVRVNGRTWTWAINYRKFRGRGPRATEHVTGADGIFEFSIEDIEQHETKSCLFQAKTSNEDRLRLLAQSILLSTWREAAFMIRYSPHGYTAFDLDDAQKVALGLTRPNEVPLDDFLVNSFIACVVGDSELHYEPADRVLRWRDVDGKIVHTQFVVRHRFQLRVEGPGRFHNLGTRIKVDDIHHHRMEATDEEILWYRKECGKEGGTAGEKRQIKDLSPRQAPATRRRRSRCS